jgi:hypothetical protein
MKSGDEAAFGEKGWAFLVILRANGGARGHHRRNLLTLLLELELDLHESPDPDVERTDERLAIVETFKNRGVAARDARAA